MSPSPIITLLTDFGTSGPYVAAMKGVILGICPAARIVDITHDISPQDVSEGAYVWAASFSYFPKATIHVGVVDPGVGGHRRPVAVRAAGHIFICPDNGLLSWVLADHPQTEAFELRRKEFFLPSVSSTFHGRDIFAPAAAHIAKGTSLARLGPPAGRLLLHEVPRPQKLSDVELLGTVVHIDTFGNLVTNITLPDCENLTAWSPTSASVVVGGRKISGLRRTYQDVPPGEPLAYFGSLGRLELAVNKGSAAQILKLNPRDSLNLILESTHT